MIRTSLLCLLLLSLSCIANSYLLEGTNSVDSEESENESRSPNRCRGKRCLPAEAWCQKGECECKWGYSGDGNLVCYKPDAYGCCVRFDPKVRNLMGETFDLSSPCRTKLIDYAYFYPNKEESTGRRGVQCSVQAFSYGEQDLGKLYIGGVDARLQVNDDTVYYRAFGKVVEANNGWRYQFQIQVSTNGRDWQDATSGKLPKLGGLTYSVNWNAKKRAFFTVPACKFTLIFRPPHPAQGANQVRIPGACVIVDKNEDKWGNPQGVFEWSTDDTVCSGPNGPGLNETASRLGLSSLNDAATYLSLLPKHQTPSFISKRCQLIANDISSRQATNPECSAKGLKYCNFLLSNPHAVNCLSKGSTDSLGTRLLEFYQDCINTMCNGDARQCVSFRSKMLSESSCNAEKVFNGWSLTDGVCNQM